MSDGPDHSDFEAKLWRSAHEEKPSALVRESVLAAALTAAGVAGGGGGASNAPPAPGTATAVKGVALGWKLAAAVVVAAGAAAVFFATRPAEGVAPMSAAPVISLAPAASTAPLEATPVVPVTAPPLPASEPSAPAARPVPPPAPTAPPSPRALTLADEIVAIDAARAALARGDRTAALRSLDGYDRTFPHGALAPEAAALRARVKKSRANADAGAP